MLILLSQNEQGISALDLQKHIFPSGSASMKSTFPWMQRHYVNYYKGDQLSVGKPRTDSVPPTMQSQIPKSRDVTLFF